MVGVMLLSRPTFFLRQRFQELREGALPGKLSRRLGLVSDSESAQIERSLLEGVIPDFNALAQADN